jgi:phosphoglycerate-specific signal transduction histidine kinase
MDWLSLMAEYGSALPTQQTSPEYPSALPARQQPRAQNFERSRYTLPVLLGVTQETVEQAEAQGQINQLNRAAQEQATVNTWTRMERRIDQNFRDQVPVEDAATQLAELYSQNPFIGSLVDPALVAQVMSSDNDLAKQTMYDRLRKVAILNDITAEIANQQEGRTWPKTIIDFVDSMASVPFDTNLAAQGRARTAAQITQLLSSNLPDEQFAAEVRNLMTEVADQGWLTESNGNYLMDMFAILPEGGEGVDADISSADL